MTAPITTFSGLASGIDTAALIKASVQVAQGPINRLQAQKAAYNVQSKKLTDIKTKLTTLQTAAKALDTRTDALLNKAVTSDDKVLKVKAAGGSSLGNFELTVTSVAKPGRNYTDPVAAADQASLFGTGVLSIQIGSGTPVDITVDINDTLESVVGKINGAEAGVTAGLTASGAGYRIQVSGNAPGAANAVTFTESSELTLGLSKVANEIQAATDTVIEMDGFSSSSASSSVTGLIPGVTIEALAEGTASVKVERDPDALKTKLDTFVSAYNDIRKVMNAEFTYNGVAKGRESLSGDSTLRGIQSKLSALVTQHLSELDGAYTTFGSIGLSVQRDGSLSLDADKLQKAVAADYEGVTRLLSNDGDELGLMVQIRDALDPISGSDGSLSTRIKNMSDNVHSIDAQIDRTQLRVDKYEDNLRAQYAALEALIGGLNSQGQALTSMVSSMNNSNK